MSGEDPLESCFSLYLPLKKLLEISVLIQVSRSGECDKIFFFR